MKAQLPTTIYIPKIAFKDGTVEFVTKILSTIGSVERVDLETRYDLENQPFYMGFIYFSNFEANDFVTKLVRDFEKNGKANFKHPELRNSRYWILLENKTPRTLEDLKEEKEDEKRIEEYIENLSKKEIENGKEVKMYHDVQFYMLNDLFMRYMALYSKMFPKNENTYMDYVAYCLDGNGAQSICMKNAVTSLLFQHIPWLYSVMLWKRTNTMEYLYNMDLCGKDLTSIRKFIDMFASVPPTRTQNELPVHLKKMTGEEHNPKFEKLELYRRSSVPLPTHFLIPRIHNSVKPAKLYEHIKSALTELTPLENDYIHLFEKTKLDDSFYSIQFSVDWYSLDKAFGLNYELVRKLFKTHFLEVSGVCQKDKKKFWKVVAFYDELEVETYNYLNYVVEYDEEELEDINNLFFDNIFLLQDQMEFLEEMDVAFLKEITDYSGELRTRLNEMVDAAENDDQEKDAKPVKIIKRQILEEGEVIEDEDEAIESIQAQMEEKLKLY